MGENQTAEVKPRRLNLGSGHVPLEGYENLDINNGQPAYPLTGYAAGSLDEVRAVHLLEHFPHRGAQDVVNEWARVLRPGGVLKISVPDADKLVAMYAQSTANFPWEQVMMGGQTDANDFHRAIYNARKLTAMLRKAGLGEVQEWKSDVQDCSSYGFSLNLQGRKQGAELYLPKCKVEAVINVPRLGFQDNFLCAFTALVPLHINIRKVTGVFWGQCMERAFQEALDAGNDLVLAMDYDTIFTRQDVEQILKLMDEHPEADAIAPLQSHRCKDAILCAMLGPDGMKPHKVPWQQFQPEVQQIATAHFGLTAIRTAAIKKLQHPWFWAQPAADGTWKENEHVDADIYFWRKFEAAGCKLFMANHVVVGHAELAIRWPGPDLKPIYQHTQDYYSAGRPVESWH